MQGNFENLGDDVDYLTGLVTYRQFESINNLDGWAKGKTIEISFQFTRASY